ncbi:class I SAM-dependent methyltransferase [Tenuibacillus multivorans]|uniref:Ubiquinone/menaquinone biosynthesis C-methylase UbiE n=1 Tax=Tenuibacillus multivorans TaxID=237069 RepID=A0A1H0B013_9BACI|nr:class I SAM-dependent methyltransferase [Tenuibacillus multivorans]GEL77590.1 SAM-dependent methyltransferase [Tenuibacillus multivorans]SDN39004.1 Ubiquinone/menaquinone biosynthesis C-methylase UbiE [Tenuibacillus multivorans]
MLRSTKETKELFNQWAQSYDQDLENASGPLLGYEQSLAISKELLSIKKNAKLLDIGIGTGAFSSLLSETDTEVWGIDISEDMVIQCEKKHPEYYLKVGTFSEPNVDQTFDYIVSSFCFHEVLPDQRKQALQNGSDLLKSGGKLLLLDIMFASKQAVQDGKEAIGEYWDSTGDYPIIGELDAMLRETGFINAHWIQTGPYHWAVLADKNNEITRNSPLK